MTVTERCRCDHLDEDHDAGECWAHIDGRQCGCSWWEPQRMFTPDEIVAGVERALNEKAFEVIPGLVKLLAVQDPHRAQTVLAALQGRITVDLR